MTNTIVGRHEEIALFEEKLSSNSAEFIAVYGRRRVGKTYLINQFFTQKTGAYFEQTGLEDGGLHEQLTVFSKMLSKSFYGSSGFLGKLDLGYLRVTGHCIAYEVTETSRKSSVLDVNEIKELA